MLQDSVVASPPAATTLSTAAAVGGGAGFPPTTNPLITNPSDLLNNIRLSTNDIGGIHDKLAVDAKGGDNGCSSVDGLQPPPPTANLLLQHLYYTRLKAMPYLSLMLQQQQLQSGGQQQLLPLQQHGEYTSYLAQLAARAAAKSDAISDAAAVRDIAADEQECSDVNDESTSSELSKDDHENQEEADSEIVIDDSNND